MTTSVQYEQLARLSFPDAQVESVGVDLPARRMALRLDGAWLDGNGGESIGPGELLITGWDQLDVGTYAHETNLWFKAGFTPLRDICEFLVEPSRIVLRGFAKDSGQWTEVAAVGGQIHATYTVQTKTS